MTNIYQSLLKIRRSLPPRPMLIGRPFELECYRNLVEAVDDGKTPIRLWSNYDVRESDEAPMGKVILIQKANSDPFDHTGDTSIIDVQMLVGKSVDELRMWTHANKEINNSSR